MSTEIIVVAHLLGLLVAAPASETAGPDRAAAGPHGASSTIAAAQTEFERGVARFEEGDLAGALDAFRRAYELEPHPRLFYNIGVVELQMGRHAAAARSLTRYLDEGGDAVDPRRRAEVEGRLEELSQRVAKLTVRCNVEGAQVRIDGELVGTTPLERTLVVDPGTRRVDVSAEGYAPSVDSITMVGGQDLVLEPALTKTVATPPAGPTPPPVDRARPTTDAPLRPLRISTYVTLGATVAGGAAAIVSGVLALRADDALGRQLATYPADPAAVSDARKRRDTLTSATNGVIATTAILAAATLGTGVAALVLARKRKHRRVQVAGLAIRF